MNYFIIGCSTRLNSMRAKKKKLGTCQILTPKWDIPSAPHVTNMLSSIPEDLHEMFMPDTTEELDELEMRLATFGKVQEDRGRVRILQSQFELSLRPNMSLEDTIVRVRVKILGKSILKEGTKSSYRDSNGGRDTF